MDCEFENRCLNSDKCFRCFNQALLKLPEDKQKSKHSRQRVHSKATAAADDSWKDLEEQVAAKLNRVPTIKEARRARASGALWFEKGDVVDDVLHPECKERKGRDLLGGEKSISIQRGWLEKAKEECRGTSKIMSLPFRFKEDEHIYCILEIDDIADLVTNTKAYMMDNEVKAQEIALLKEQIAALKKEIRP